MDVGAVVGQGTKGGAVFSQKNVDRVMERYMGSSQDEVYYGRIRLESAIYKDDICKPSLDVIKKLGANIRMSVMLKEKGLKAHKTHWDEQLQAEDRK